MSRIKNAPPIELLARVYERYLIPALIEQGEDMCADYWNVCESGASRTVPEITSEPERNRRRRRHNKCAEESASSI